jgi:hypothetical protein
MGTGSRAAIPREIGGVVLPSKLRLILLEIIDLE